MIQRGSSTRANIMRDRDAGTGLSLKIPIEDRDIKNEPVWDAPFTVNVASTRPSGALSGTRAQKISPEPLGCICRRILAELLGISSGTATTIDPGATLKPLVKPGTAACLMERVCALADKTRKEVTRSRNIPARMVHQKSLHPWST